MEMKKIAFATFMAASASLSAAVATIEAQAPAPASDAATTLPTVGTLVGASLLSFFAYYTRRRRERGVHENMGLKIF
ncbi:hypothetical protein Acr_08g0006480 [Actinidia rufa]|uniref:Transmembrane protein n=1 Tax=Actinidia rufa TaxID=165716 RepID=A0A7J0F0P8_9ERIC|nr:hypothetical protein Acr_08g0006480 [Actinidia rufa]